MLIGFTSLSFAQLDNEKPVYVPRDYTDNRLGYEIFDNEGEKKHILNFKEVDTFEHKFFDVLKGNYNDNITNSEFELKPFIDWNSKISIDAQRDVHFIKSYLAQTMLEEEINELQYKFVLEFDEDAADLPDYVTVVGGNREHLTQLQEEISSLPEHVASEINNQIEQELKNEKISVLVPLNKMYDLEDIEKLKHVTTPSSTLKTFGNPYKEIPTDLVYEPVNYLAPKKQFDNGLLAFQIQCNTGLELALNLSDKTPACMTLETLEKLEQRNSYYRMR